MSRSITIARAECEDFEVPASDPLDHPSLRTTDDLQGAVVRRLDTAGDGRGRMHSGELPPQGYFDLGVGARTLAHACSRRVFIP